MMHIISAVSLLPAGVDDIPVKIVAFLQKLITVKYASV